MVNNCALEGCNSGYLTGETKSSFYFPEEDDLRKRWVYFVNRVDWLPSKHSVICIEHFEPRFIKRGKKRCKLRWELHPVPTIHTTEAPSAPSKLRVPVVPRRSPKKRKLGTDEMVDFLNQDKVSDFSSFDENHAPANYLFKRQDNAVQYCNLVFDTSTGVPAVHECVTISKDLHVSLAYNGFRSGHNFTITRFGMLENFASHVRNKGSEYDIILKELNHIQHYKPLGRPKYSSTIIRFALLLRYSSCQTYKLLIEQFPLPSLSLLKQLSTGGIDAVKVAKLLLEIGIISSDCVLIVGEMYLQKSVQYHSGDFIGQDEDGILYKGIVVFMIVSLKKSRPESKISGEWLKNEIDDCLCHLQKVGFNVRAVVSDVHASNVRGFSLMHNQLYIYGFIENLVIC